MPSSAWPREGLQEAPGVREQFSRIDVAGTTAGHTGCWTPRAPEPRGTPREEAFAAPEGEALLSVPRSPRAPRLCP